MLNRLFLKVCELNKSFVFHFIIDYCRQCLYFNYRTIIHIKQPNKPVFKYILIEE